MTEAKTPSSCPSFQGEKERLEAPSPPPYPLADMATLSGKLAKASLLGEGWGEGVFSP
jgi:hypothetical protein